MSREKRPVRPPAVLRVATLLRVATALHVTAVLLLAGCAAEPPPDGPPAGHQGSGSRVQSTVEPVSPEPPPLDPLILEPHAPIQTDALAYTARHEAGEGTHARFGFYVVARFTNPTPDTVYLARAYPDSPHPSFHVGGAAYNRVGQGVHHNHPFAVAPGATRVDTLHVWGPTVWDGRTGAFDGWLEGRMRVHYRAQGCRPSGGCPLPDSVAVSNMFRVRLEETGGRGAPARPLEEVETSPLGLATRLPDSWEALRYYL